MMPCRIRLKYRLKFSSLASGLLLFTALGVGSRSFAEEPLDQVELLKTRPPRIHFWALEMGVNQFNFTAPDDSKVAGLGASFALGYGRIHENSWVNASYHFFNGPWESARNHTFDVDSSGSLVDVEYGRAFPGFSLRSNSSPFLAISGGYLAMSTKNIGSNRKNTIDPNEKSNFYLEQDFKTTVEALVMTPTVGWNWVKPARPSGNEPELLMTRIESSYLKLGAEVPLYSKSRVKVLKRSSSDTLSQTPTQHTTTGAMTGYSLIMTGGVWLGI